MGIAPVEAIEACPGERTLEVAARGRMVWRSVEEFPLDGELTVEVHPRPNAVLIGADAWPPGLEELAAHATANEDSVRRMEGALRELLAESETLRDDVTRFTL